MKRWVITAMLLTTSLLSPPAGAFVEDPYITPAHPTPQTPISVHVTAGWCHASSDAVDGAELVAVSPGQLQLITNGVVLPPGHPFCIHPPFDYRFDIGTLPVGTYTLQFFIRDDIGFAGLVGFGSVDFVVAPPSRIPATSGLALAMIGIAVCCAGAAAARVAPRD